MSLIHFLTIGRFRFHDDARPPSIAARTVAHFVQGGLVDLELKQVKNGAQPFSNDELARIASELQHRFDVDVTLRDYLRAKACSASRTRTSVSTWPSTSP